MPIKPLKGSIQEESWLYSEQTLNVWDPHGISKAEPSHLAAETQFQPLVSLISFFRSSLKAHNRRWGLENRSTGKLKALLSCSVSLYHNDLVQSPHHCLSLNNPPAHLTFHVNLIHEYELKLLKAITHSQTRESNALFSGREPWSQTWMCWLSSCLIHTQMQIIPVHAEDHDLKRATEPHRLQRA